MPSGYTAELPSEVLPDVGVISRDLADVQATIGVTRGGWRHQPQKETRNIPFDGQRAPIAGNDRITSHGARMSGTFIQFGKAQIDVFEPGSTATEDAGPPIATTIQPAAASTLIAVGDIVKNLTWTQNYGDGGELKIVYPYAICTEFEVVAQDNDEVTVQATFEARLDPADAVVSTDKAPYHYIVTEAAA